MKNKTEGYNEEAIRTEAINETVKGISPKLLQDPIFVKRVADKFMQMKINQFPALCERTRRDNLLMRQHLKDIDNSGGWSETKNFKFDYSIPNELYFFMVNLIAKDFWAEYNEKQWRYFMEQIVRGEDSTSLLYKMKLYFDGNPESKKLIVK